jgi:hypothetical protein
LRHPGHLRTVDDPFSPAIRHGREAAHLQALERIVAEH